MPGPPHTECMRFGCQYAVLYDKLVTELRTRFPDLERIRIERRTNMRFTQSLWCDFQDHPFSERDKKKRALVIIGEDDDGNEVEETWTACGLHVPSGPSNSRIIKGVIDNGDQ